MKYKGQELKPITKPQIFDPPKVMYVWDGGNREPQVRNVIAILPNCNLTYRVITQGGCSWTFCCEIVKQQNSRLATYLEFSRWLANGNGQVHTDSDGGKYDTAILYKDNCDDEPVRCGLKARKWGDKEFHEPTIDYLGIKED